MPKYLYPASHLIHELDDTQLELKIARHSRCLSCSTCTGLIPPLGFTVSLHPKRDSDRDDVEEFLLESTNTASDNDDESEQPYLDVCGCSHSRVKHGADKSEIGQEEFMRRARVAIRLDELTQDKTSLLDFQYEDEDIISLRKQMTLPGSPDKVSAPAPEKIPPSPSSTLSDLPVGPPAKRRRVSYSSSVTAESADEDDQPLASRLARPTTGSKSSKTNGGSHKTSKGPHKHTKSVVPPVAGKLGASKNMKSAAPKTVEVKVKMEDTMEEGQLDDLATGVTMDASMSGSAPFDKPDKPSAGELRRGVIKIMPVENDGQPASMILLTNLKTLFQKQLPVMPREYITRLVFDPNQKCLAIVKNGYKVVGGICYRPFPHRKFAEIVFFATHSVDQVKGYGGMLMDHYKTHIKKTWPDMHHFLTYADNYAVGYFRKQGFTKDITLPRSVWAGYIKDYEGGTIMQCTMLDKVDYLNTKEILLKQRDAVLEKIRELSRSHVVYPGLDHFKSEQITPLKPEDVPGLRESGWTPPVKRKIAPQIESPDTPQMQKLLEAMTKHQHGWPFLKPVGPEIPDYAETIKNPMDFQTMGQKLKANKYANLAAFIADAQLVFDNCMLFNPVGTAYHASAKQMHKWLKQRTANQVKREDMH